MALIIQPVNAQVTFTSNGTCASNTPNYFSTASCWTATSQNACAIPGTPATNGTLACPVTFIVNHEINIGNLAIGNHFTLNVNSTGSLNITGNVTQAGQTTANVIVNGGGLNVSGSFIVNQGQNNGTKTAINLEVNSNGIFNVAGKLDMKSNSILEITGDYSSDLEVGLIDLGQKAVINIREDGRLISKGETNYAGNDSEINVYGFFRTLSLKVSGGSGKKLNTYGNANVIVDGDVRIDGSGNITFGGDSNVYIDGDVILNGPDDSLTIKDNAKVVVCGENTETNPPPSNVNKSNLNECPDPNNCATGGFYVNCRLLPVDLINFEVEHNKINNFSMLSWSTAKEWENSHFEIERSELNIKNFKKIGEVKGMGWTETISSYSFEDNNLPLSGGMVYYRLKQVDFNGKFEYSSVVSVQIPSLQFTQGIWRAYPNPTVNDQLRVSLLDRNGYTGESLTFRLIHPFAFTESKTVSTEEEMNEILANLVPKMPRGLFVVEIRWGQKVEHIKVLKK